MKYCIQYQRNFKYIKEIDEITISLSKFKKLSDIFEFSELYRDKRLNFFLDEEFEKNFIDKKLIEYFNSLNKNIDFAIKLSSYKKEIIDEIKNNGHNIKFFISTFIKDWDTLMGYVKLKPSDIYIVENLGFELLSVSKLLHENNIRVRVFPNVAQSSWRKTPPLKKFFIRPEDVYLYESYIDVFEFFGKLDSIETYYKIYNIDKKWFGKLNELILDLDHEEIDSRFILPVFAERRLNCGKRCLKGTKCRVCEAVENLSFLLEKNNLLIKTIKE